MKSIFSFSRRIIFFLFISLASAQQKTSVTITNQNLGLVKEERVISLEKGRQLNNLEDIIRIK